MNGGFPSSPRRFRTSSQPDDFLLTLWTADPVVAREADVAGVQRIGVDLEWRGKAERQRGRGTWMSPHTERDLRTLAPVVSRARLFARVNALNDDSAREIASVTSAGATVLMLPMVAAPAEAVRFVDLVAGRATVVLLVERREALAHLAGLVAVPGVSEVHVGLNDLSLSLGLANRWLLLAGETIVGVSTVVREAGLRFGLGGIGRVHDATLPIPSDLVYAEYARTSATSALLSRSFLEGAGHDLRTEIARARQRLAEWRHGPDALVAAAHEELGRRARELAGW